MKEQLISSVASVPIHVRSIFRDRKVVEALESLGILLTIFELHAPSPRTKSATGLGPTLCNYDGRRHPTVFTCKKCLAKISAKANTIAEPKKP